MCDWLIKEVNQGHCAIDIGTSKNPEKHCNTCLPCVLKGRPAAEKICGPKKQTEGNNSYHICMIEQIKKVKCPKECEKSKVQAYGCALKGGKLDKANRELDERPSVGQMCDWLIGEVKEGHCAINIGKSEDPVKHCNTCLPCVLKGEPAAEKICGPEKGATEGNNSYHACMIEQIQKLKCPKECEKSKVQAYECALIGGKLDNDEDLNHQSPDVKNHECVHNENKFRKMLAKPVRGGALDRR